MQDDHASQNEVVTGLRQAAHQPIALMDRTTDLLAKHVLATQTFELLRVASQLALNDESRAAELLDPRCSPERQASRKGGLKNGGLFVADPEMVALTTPNEAFCVKLQGEVIAH